MPKDSSGDSRSSLLVARYVERHDQEAFRELYNMFARLVRSVARKVSGIRLEPGETKEKERLDQLCQEIWAVVARKAPRFDLDRSFKSWLLGITRRAAKNEARSRAKRPEEMRALETAPVDHRERDPGEAFALKALKADVARAMSALSWDERDLIHMRFFEDWTQLDIAEFFDIAEATVVDRIKKVAEKLRPLLKAWEQIKKVRKP